MLISDIQALPKMATPDLIEEKLSVSAGVVIFGSDVFMIGGHSFVPIKHEKYGCMKEITQNCEFYKYLLMRRPLMGTSSTRDEDGFILYPYPKCNNNKLIVIPKFWYAIVEVDGQVHIFKLDHSGVVVLDFNGGWIFSHEFIMGGVTTNLDIDCFIHSYLVLDPYIYVVASLKCLVFDSRKMEWEIIGRKSDDVDRLTVKFVFDILLLRGFAWKIGEIGVGDDLQYAILVLEQNEGVMSAIVYLVTSTTRQVSSIQFLPGLFSVGSLIMPCFLLSGTVMKADEDLEGGTFCAVINAHAPLNCDYNEYDGERGAFLFIYTFKMKTLVSDVSKIPVNPSSLLPKFVSIDIKDGFVFEANAEFDRKNGGYYSHFVGIQACFVDESFVD